jgi:hypothetical protein
LLRRGCIKRSHSTLDLLNKDSLECLKQGRALLPNRQNLQCVTNFKDRYGSCPNGCARLLVEPFDNTPVSWVPHERRENVGNKGRPGELRDRMIAGIVLASHAKRATRNTSHFEDLSVPVVNPWSSSTVDSRAERRAVALGAPRMFAVSDLSRDSQRVTSTFNHMEEHGRHCKSLEVRHRQHYCVSQCGQSLTALLYFDEGERGAVVGPGNKISISFIPLEELQRENVTETIQGVDHGKSRRH